MIELNKTIATITAPVEYVFKFITNMENYGKWFPGVVAIDSKNDLPHGAIGKTYQETLILNGVEQAFCIEVIQCQENQLFLTQGELAGVLPQMTIRFTQHCDNTCEMILQYHSRCTSLDERSELIQALKQDLLARASEGVANLKRLLEHTNETHQFDY